MKKLILLFVGFALVFSCADESKVEKEIAAIDIDVVVERFDKAFASSKPEDLPKLKAAFPFMFSKTENDSVLTHRMSDTLQQQLFVEIDKVFNDFAPQEHEIKKLFQHLKYYDKTFSAPRVVTFSDYVRYRDKVYVTDTIALVALDTYLGADHEFYGGIPKYISENMKPSQITPDLAAAYADRYIYQSQRKTLLDEMIYFGKALYFMDKIIPFKTDAEKIGYTQEQLEWAISNEDQIWRYFISKELLYNTDSSLPARFTAPAPFTKFYLELDTESPGKLGQFIGWQIVKSYMENNEDDFMDMLQKDAVEIFNNAKYKPNR